MNSDEESDATTEVYSDEEHEDPYYPETERVQVTTTRSGRPVYSVRRLIVDPDVIPGDESGDGESSVPDDESLDTVSNDDSFVEEEEEDSEEESEEESEGEDQEVMNIEPTSSTTIPSTRSPSPPPPPPPTPAGEPGRTLPGESGRTLPPLTGLVGV